MPPQPFRGLLQLGMADRSFKRLSGPVVSADTLLEPETLEALDDQFGGAYAILLHDPQVDAALHAYVTGASVAADSGKWVMVLFEPAPKAKAEMGRQFGLGEIAQSRPLVD